MSMLSRIVSAGLWAGCVIAGPAAATASLGGVVTALSGLGACHDTHSVPGTTLQDTLFISAATSCQGGSAGGTVHGDAATGAVGMSGYSTGSSPSPGSSQVAAQIQYMDHWLIGVPAGTAPGTISLPVVLTLEGTVSASALSGFNRFLDYSINIRDLYAAPIPDAPYSAILSSTGSVTATGAFSRVVTGNVNFSYDGPGSALPTTAEVSITMGYPGLNVGPMDYNTTASIALILPAGYSATTSSGIALDFTSAVPEPAGVAMLLAGLALVATTARRGGRQSDTRAMPACA
jgi:hypothetical protein